MALWDNPPHTVSSYSLTTSRDSAGGTVNTFTLTQSNIPCSINTMSAQERELFAQQQINVSHTVAILSSKITRPITRGMKLQDSAGLSYHVEGIRFGLAYGSIPAFTYLSVQQQL